ncbi:MAG: type II toxin-antitoxin system prevent-host-death family antitoxin [Deltaproteobacteria bacterium]|nr:type II toxin-antitoxin system prevent-host-death family antitoxin [Deltaproteobacteria bacterium]
MPITATQLRADLYRILDRVAKHGETVEISRNGTIVKIVPATAPGKMDRLVPRPDSIVGNPDDLVHMDWSGEWTP